MKKILEKHELNKILENHKKWLDGEPGGKCADLQRVNLQDAALEGADLRGANLRGADMKRADLRCADLRGADLRAADLRRADLRGADLRGSDLRGANLRVSNIKGADLRGADLGRAYTEGAEMDAETKIDWPMACPKTGALIGWKKVSYIYIVKLEIPADAKRSSATTHKCRASKAKVLEIQTLYGEKACATKVESDRGGVYKVGKMVYPDEWDDNRWNECSHGIHFFMTRAEAVEW